MQGKRRILVADPSKVVRSTLAKHLKDDFDVREEQDGESAWQTLVLDASIVAVVAGVHLGRIDGFELLERLRSNRLRRLTDMPFMVLVSSDETADRREAAKARGVSDFLVRGMGGAEIRQRIGRLIDWDIASDCGLRQLAPATPPPPFPAITDHLADLEKLAAECVDRKQALTLLAFGLEREAMLLQRFGERPVNQLGERIARVIRGKIGARDRMFHHGGSNYLIASPGTSPATCLAFAQRVCRGLGESSVMLAGERMQIAVCAGLASTPAGEAIAPAELLPRAVARLGAARAIGGDRVVDDDPDAPDDERDYFSALRDAMRESSITAHLGMTGLHLMPLLRLFEQEFHFGLPLKDMEQLFRQRAHNEESPD